ncbi:MAG: cytochrome c oxidase assembly protein [Acidobacteria bacterium]|nr:cytochrome c oxidase assembly protein [Acidobacteriota bacterium]
MTRELKKKLIDALLLFTISLLPFAFCLLPFAFFLLLLPAWVYARGWWRLHQQTPQRFGVWRILCFFAGLAVIFLAIASPLDAFAGLLLIVHMTQHLLLTMVAPPLILLGAPYLPLLRGLPPKVLKHGVGPFLAWPALQRFGRFLTHPIVCWLTFALTTMAWHLPVFYELALRAEFWHRVEHLCFFGAAILFWWPVIQPEPGMQHWHRWPRWTMILYLFLADLQNTALSAFLSFYERVIYPTYTLVPRISRLTALEDQIGAGALMWFVGSLAYLIPAGLLTIEMLSSGQGVRPSSLYTQTQRSLRMAPRRKAWDLLSAPVVGAALRWRHFRRVAQTVMLLLAMTVVADGLFGHQMGSMNLAGVLPWTHWRGLVVIALLAAGNFFCMACPFMLTRDLGRRVMPGGWNWPGQLRSKWFAVGLLALYLWAYEAFDLWDSPWWTAWIVVGYFVTSFVIDGLFKGASFCKYVCPIGQFNFVQSLVSPLEVKVRDLDQCRTCTTYDCIRGNSVQRGCELQLFQPKKAGNMDCTFCLDCVHACPHNNVGILAFVPTSQLTHDRYRSSLGRLSQRPDIATLILLLVFGAFINAAGMLKPVATWEESLRARFNLNSLLPIDTILFVISLLILPLILAGLCGTLSRALGGIRAGWRDLTCSFVVSLVPLGFSMWLAHLVFHLLTGSYAIVPTTQRAVADLGIGLFGKPNWGLLSVVGPFDWLPSLQILLLVSGLLLTLYTSWRIAQRYTSRGACAFGLFVPWAAMAVGLYIVGVWIIFQPMQMRGMMMH